MSLIRFNARKKSHRRTLKPIGIRTRNKNFILDQVRAIILDMKERFKLDPKNRKLTFVFKEDLALRLKCKIHQIEYALHKLNLEGLVFQPEHNAMHDTPRERFSYGNASGWCPDIYRINFKK